MVAIVGFLAMLFAMLILFAFAEVIKRAKRNSNKNTERIVSVLLWFVTIAFCSGIIFIFTSAAFCFPANLGEWVRGKPCGVVKTFEIVSPQNGEAVKANMYDKDGDSIKISGKFYLPEIVKNKKICIASQSNDSRTSLPPIIRFQGYAQVDSKNNIWTLDNCWVGSNESPVPRGDGSCVRQYRIVAIALDDSQITQLGLPLDNQGIWNEKTIEWQNVEKLMSPTYDNFDEIGIGAYVFEKDAKCRTANGN